MATEIDFLYGEAAVLLRDLIAIPSFSREEDKTAERIGAFLEHHAIRYSRAGNNIYAYNAFYDPAKPTILLNSHHDTVKPNKGYTLDPFQPLEKDGRLYGLGSNDAGGCLVSLAAAFLHFASVKEMTHNLIFAATAEEEISGSNGVEMILPLLGKIDMAIVGEPTLLDMAVAERGLMVIDCVAPGRAGHAARDEADNAIYHAVEDIAWIKNYHFEKTSPLLGQSRMTVTVIQTDNQQHNVVPASCKFVIDVRVNECYSFEEILDTLRQNLRSSVMPRSTRLRSTSIPMDHPLVKAGLKLGRGYYGSPTTSDKALMPFPALKMGPGDSARSHTADEFILLSEIRDGIQTYIALLNEVLLQSAG